MVMNCSCTEPGGGGGGGGLVGEMCSFSFFAVYFVSL